MLMLQGINTKQEVDTLEPDDSIAMVCAKCKTVYVTRVKQGVKGAQILMEKGQPKELIGTHACAGCNSTITVTGHAKGDITELRHSCKACGDDSGLLLCDQTGQRRNQRHGEEVAGAVMHILQCAKQEMVTH